MKKPTKLLISIACCFLLAVFFVPVWHIRLEAPQYPGGLDMFIWIYKISGTDEFTLQNINILNHYIGMRAIDPASFKELRIMPFVVIFFIMTGLIIAYWNKNWALVLWLTLLIIGGTIGLVDFYLWQQAFGNELDPNAPIKMVGMSYSPPFLGYKKILNIEASSYPHWGGVFFGIAILLGILAVVDAFRTHLTSGKTASGLAVISLVTLSCCQPQRQEIDYGFDSCAHCKMTISDQRYGAELVTKKGKVYKFDAIECMTEFYRDAPGDYALVMVTAISSPGKFIDAKHAWYLQSEALPSPMGMNLNAFEREDEARKYANKLGGEVLDWNGIATLKFWGHVEKRTGQQVDHIK